MVIAVNTKFLPADYLEGRGNFIYETFKRISQKNPEHQFIFIFDRPYDERFITGKNVKGVTTGPAGRHPLWWKFWFDVKVTAVLRKYKANVFVCGDGVCSLHTKVPQCLLVHDLAYLHYPSLLKKTHLLFYKKYMPTFLSRASTIVTSSEFTKQDIISQYKTAADKIDVVFKGVKEIFQPVSEEDKEATKKIYTNDKEYFAYTGSIHPQKNLVTLLKAFSVFKKRQQTNMKLVLTGKVDLKFKSFTENLKSYKYRNDVVMTGYVEESELVKITGSAYGLIYPSLFEGFGVPVLEAMQCEVPVITSTNTAMQEITKQAALYADPNSHADIADKMMLLYKDENLRKTMIRKGRQVANEYNWERTAELFWQTILKSAEKNP